MTLPSLSCAFAPGPTTASDIALAEDLGFTRAWCYDSPAFYDDVWTTLARAADRTDRIGLGPAVVVPSLRHPMVTAAALHGLDAQAPGRVAAAFGTGFTGRAALGQPPLRWAEVESYLACVRSLLLGKQTEWEGAVIALLERAPVDVPLLVAADGPRGRAVATAGADGMFCAVPPPPEPGLPAWRALMTFGTVLDHDEALDSARVLAAVGPALAVVYHSVYERSAAGVDALPGGEEWRLRLEALPPAERHLALHEGHLLRVNERDEGIVAAGAPMLPVVTFTGTREELLERGQALLAAGITEVVVQPAGDVADELRRWSAAWSLA